MHSLTQLKQPPRLLLIVLALAYFALFPTAQAVVPAPDGGYPNFTTAEGTKALQHLTTGAANTGIGWYALFSAGAANYNTSVGTGALALNTADSNTAVGTAALILNITGSDNTAVGTAALLNNDEGVGNTATGSFALNANNNGFQNTASGAFALSNNTTGSFNTANGHQALNNNTTGEDNTAVGDGALFSNSTGIFNTAVGQSALNQNTTGNTNVAIGAGACGGVFTADNVICIGASVAGNNVSNTCFVGNIRGVATHNANAIPVLIDSAGQLGTASSSARFKTDIQCMNNASEAILALEPVTFHYKSDSTGTAQFGLIAEQVASVNPDLVVRDDNRDVYTVRYDAVNAMLLNEFLKEHAKVQEQEATIAELKRQMATVVEHLQQHESKIQRVSDQLEMSRSEAQVVAKD